MDREGFRNRLKQYKKAREENPGLKYWEWKNIPKYAEGTPNVYSTEDNPIYYEEESPTTPVKSTSAKLLGYTSNDTGLNLRYKSSNLRPIVGKSVKEVQDNGEVENVWKRVPNENYDEFTRNTADDAAAWMYNWFTGRKEAGGYEDQLDEKFDTMLSREITLDSKPLQGDTGGLAETYGPNGASVVVDPSTDKIRMYATSDLETWIHEFAHALSLYRHKGGMFTSSAE